MFVKDGLPACAEEARLARKSASWICALPDTGHHPSATRHLRVTSMDSMFSVWYTAFSDGQITRARRVTWWRLSQQTRVQSVSMTWRALPKDKKIDARHVTGRCLKKMLASSQGGVSRSKRGLGLT